MCYKAMVVYYKNCKVTISVVYTPQCNSQNVFCLERRCSLSQSCVFRNAAPKKCSCRISIASSLDRCTRYIIFCLFCTGTPVFFPFIDAFQRDDSNHPVYIFPRENVGDVHFSCCINIQCLSVGDVINSFTRVSYWEKEKRDWWKDKGPYQWKYWICMYVKEDYFFLFYVIVASSQLSSYKSVCYFILFYFALYCVCTRGCLVF